MSKREFGGERGKADEGQLVVQVSQEARGNISEQKKNFCCYQHEDKNKKLQLQVTQYKEKCRRLEKNHKQSSKKIEAQIRDLVSSQIKQLKSGIQFEKLQNQLRLKDLQKQVMNYQNLLRVAQLKKKENENLLSELLERRREQDNNINRPNPQKDHAEISMKRQIEVLKQSNMRLTKNVKDQKIQIQQLLEKIKNHQITINQLKKYQRQSQQTKQKSSKALVEEKAKNIKLNAEILSLSISQKNLNKKLQNLSSRIPQIEKQNEKLNKEISIYKKMDQSNKEDIDRLRNELQSYQADNKILRRERQRIQNMVQTLKIQCSIQNLNSLDTFQVFYESIINYKYFSDSKFLKDLEYQKKLFLVSSLKQFLSITTFRGNLLYRYDDINPVNFHKYIDGHENILLVIHLSDGSVIGGFSADPFITNSPKRPGKGFLFSLATQKIYPLKNNTLNPAITYDEYYLIFGNSEITIKSQDKRLFSNFGIRLSSFDSLGDSSQQFLRTRSEGIREIEIENYQIYNISEK